MIDGNEGCHDEACVRQHVDHGVRSNDVVSSEYEVPR